MLTRLKFIIVMTVLGFSLAGCSWDDVFRSTLEGAKSACKYQKNCSVDDDTSY